MSQFTFWFSTSRKCSISPMYRLTLLKRHGYRQIWASSSKPIMITSRMSHPKGQSRIYLCRRWCSAPTSHRTLQHRCAERRDTVPCSCWNTPLPVQNVAILTHYNGTSGLLKCYVAGVSVWIFNELAKILPVGKESVVLYSGCLYGCRAYPATDIISQKL